ncbi:G-protein coupled receptor moody-like [Maniola jurtina]|uniref:G-protein coupled receptor moody-like n=1 Tax=Maniola jurtina TaxID=191418 RepID=UPI001E68DECD|nr:G-protein coupled receptor moody-like [Maniola jurtina]
MYDVRSAVFSSEMESIPNVLMNSSVVTALSDADLAAIELFKGYPDGLLKFATACCGIFMVIGIPGNIITIVALARYEKVRNATAIFIMNLSCSDLLFCCFNLPLAGSTFFKRSWPHGQLLCRLFPLARYALVAVSLFTVLAITVNRYVMIAHPKLYPKLYKTRNISIMLIAIWAVSFGVVTPAWFGKWGVFGLDTNIGSCSILSDQWGHSPKKSLFLTAFILPCLAIILCYARIFFIVRKATKKSLPKAKKAPASEESSSADVSSSVSARLTTDNSSSYNVEQINNAHVSFSQNGVVTQPRITTFSVETRDEIVRYPVDIQSEPVRLRRTALRKSMALLKITLPSRKDRRLGTMIIAIMISFCLCHLPITITKVLRELNPYPASNIASYILLYLSSSINPLIYVLMSSEYRKAYKNLFRRRNKVARISLRNNR